MAERPGDSNRIHSGSYSEQADGGPDQVMVVFCTAPEDRAPAIARVLVDRHLAACVNVAAVRSFYRWEGEYVEDTEALLIIKTTRRRLEEAVTAIRDLHPYSLPEMIALPVAAGYFPYLSWVREETGI